MHCGYFGCVIIAVLIFVMSLGMLDVLSTQTAGVISLLGAVGLGGWWAYEHFMLRGGVTPALM